MIRRVTEVSPLRVAPPVPDPVCWPWQQLVAEWMPGVAGAVPRRKSMVFAQAKSWDWPCERTLFRCRSNRVSFRSFQFQVETVRLSLRVAFKLKLKVPGEHPPHPSGIHLAETLKYLF